MQAPTVVEGKTVCQFQTANHALRPMLEGHALRQLGVDRAAPLKGSVCVMAIHNVSPMKSREFFRLHPALHAHQGRNHPMVGRLLNRLRGAATGRLWNWLIAAAPCLPAAAAGARHRQTTQGLLRWAPEMKTSRNLEPSNFATKLMLPVARTLEKE